MWHLAPGGAPSLVSRHGGVYAEPGCDLVHDGFFCGRHVMNRRGFLKTAGLSALATGLLPQVRAADSTMASAIGTPAESVPADYAIRIETGLLELAPGRTIATTLYNGQFPGPLLRLKEGRRVMVDIVNDTDTPEQLHWHGQYLPDAVDGAAEERTPFIPPHGRRREVFVPGPAGLRFYHSHVRAGVDLHRGLYTGQVGPVFIEPKHDPGSYDREVFLTLKEFEPYLTRSDTDTPFMAPAGMDDVLIAIAAGADPDAGRVPPGYELAYHSFAINGRMLGHAEPIRVKRGERVLLHVVNGSATEVRSLALPGHVFKVVALDGNPVPHPAEVPVLWLGNAERVSAIVEMDQPGVWVLGDVNDHDRQAGMGIVVEYAGATGKPVWQKPAPFLWDYRRFADASRPVQTPDAVIDLVFTARHSAAQGFNLWSVNGVPYDSTTMPVTQHLRLGRRYRLRMRNASDDLHPLHLHRHSFELTRIAGHRTAGVLKDVVMVAPFQTVEADFTANQPGLTLFHCHMQSHMDFGFMGLFETR
ncbi:multicopper oxidase family protein [Dyella sp. A6]|uniref:multicopper oxidase family protein n=1 Tax=Dyella aluminiiresistens TaxID=3069105 RepID=UPI002E785AB5|nr:multicopper oxidase domain-containing protein [Dyella sp. A6]